MDREIAEQEEQEKEKEATPKHVVRSTPKSAKRWEPFGLGSQTQSQARDNEDSGVEFL